LKWPVSIFELGHTKEESHKSRDLSLVPAIMIPPSDSCRLQDTLPLAIEQAQKLTLKDHPHTGSDPVPAFHTEEEITAALALAKKRKTVVTTPSIRKRALPSEAPPVIVKPIATPCAPKRADKSVPKVEEEVVPAPAVQLLGDWKVPTFCGIIGWCWEMGLLEVESWSLYEI